MSDLTDARIEYALAQKELLSAELSTLKFEKLLADDVIKVGVKAKNAALLHLYIKRQYSSLLSHIVGNSEESDGASE
jgi:hypothetical protein